jgi:hypothetical protein
LKYTCICGSVVPEVAACAFFHIIMGAWLGSSRGSYSSDEEPRSSGRIMSGFVRVGEAGRGG